VKTSIKSFLSNSPVYKFYISFYPKLKKKPQKN